MERRVILFLTALSPRTCASRFEKIHLPGSPTIVLKQPSLLAVSRLALPAMIALATHQSHANGYHFLHQSAEGFGSAYSSNGTAINDISAMFSNPASIARFDGTNVSASLALDFPRSTFDNVVATAPYSGAPVTGTPAEPTQFIDTAVGAATYASRQMNDKLYFGLSFTAPYAYVSEYPREAASRYQATLTKLYAYNLSPALAYKVDDKLTLAVGVNFQYYTNKLNTMVSTDITNPAPGTDVKSEIEAQDLGYGFSLGMEYQFNPSTRIGMSYRSKINHSFDGDLRLSGTTANMAALQAEIPTLNANQGSADFGISTPSMLQVGLLHKLTDKLELYANANLTGWSVFKDTHIRFNNGLPDVVVDNGWEDSWYVGIGAGYQWNDRLKLRTGVAYDWTPTPAPTVSPRAPNHDRMYAALGLSYQASPAWKLDAGYLFILFEEVHVRLAGGNNVSRGTLSGDINLYANVFMFQANHRF
jgi:long-chain fatty acid transport protein